MIQKLSRNDVELQINPEELKTFSADKADIEIIGQPRAVAALTLGTEIRSKGYNIFVTGETGTGRTTAIKKILEHHSPADSRIQDIGIVYNFKDPDRPKVLYFEKGMAKGFKNDLHSLIEKLKILIKARLDSDTYKAKRDKLVSLIEKEENHRLNEFEAKIREHNFAIIKIEEEGSLATDIFPLYKDEAVDFDQLQALVIAGEMTEEEWNNRREEYYRYIDEMKSIYSELKLSRAAMEEDISVLQIETIRPNLEEEMSSLRRQYTGKEVSHFLDELQQDVIDHIHHFTTDEVSSGESDDTFLVRYRINILVDNSELDKAPVIFENYPTASNLIGNIEYQLDLAGESKISFMNIKPGSIIRGSGGFLIIRAEDLLQEEDAWFQLKRVLQTGKVEIQTLGGPLGLPGPSLKPEPVAVDIKIMLVGGENLYDVLYNTDTDFQKFFKVNAEFDSVMDLTPQSKTRYISFIQRKGADNGLRQVTWRGIAEIIKFGIGLAEQRDKISTRFSLVSDILTEADYWAGKRGSTEIDAEDVTKTVDVRTYLHNMPQEKTEEYIQQGDLIIPLDGEAVGRVNGLAVHDRGYYSYGSPAQVSARIAPGEEGIINIEREVGLSGEIHDKWVLILAGFLRSRYGRNFPVSIFASICFEQNYSEIDGDSASSTELYALLSAIINQPLRQDIAVTGSVNQHGQIQSVGGISEKISGFFAVCRNYGLTGKQGVIIPETNCKNLILPAEIAEAVEQEVFHIYSVSTIDEGMSILTGKEMGEEQEDGTFPKNTINWQIERRLRDIASQVKKFNG